MSEEVLTFKPEEVARLIKEGKMVVTTAPSTTEHSQPDQITFERAKDILGQDFLGLEAIRNMEVKLRSVGQNVEFSIQELPSIPYSEKDLELAKQNGEMLILRVGATRINGKNIPLTLINFMELFRKDPLNKITTPFYSFRKDVDDWYEDHPFAINAGQINLGWAIVTKDILPDTTGKTWNQQTKVAEAYKASMIGKGASLTDFKRRTATEAIWDTMLYYITTGIQLLSDKYDWTQTQAQGGGLVSVGRFVVEGAGVNGWAPGYSGPNRGVVLSR